MSGSDHHRLVRRAATLLLLGLLAALLAGCAQQTALPGTPEPTVPVPTLPVASPTVPTIEPASPTATPVAAEGAGLSWSEPPTMALKADTAYLATLKTEKGDVTLQLFADRAPETVNNFVFLARNGFYDNTTFHRVNENLVQGGDPTGTGDGGPGYLLQAEFDPELRFDRPGLLGMANQGAASNGSQFFVTRAPVPWLTGQHTLFGQVVEGLEVLDQLTPRDPEGNPGSAGDRLLGVEIREVDPAELPTPTPSPTPFAPQAKDGERPLAAIPPAERDGYWNSPPENLLEPGQVYLATFHTELGDIVVELMPGVAPRNVNNLVALANAGYYDGTHFYHVVEGNVAVGGDPLDTGQGGPGYSLEDELAPGAFGEAGWLGSMQYAPNDNRGQFFFTLGPSPELAGSFSPLGRVLGGWEVLEELAPRDVRQDSGSPGTRLESVEIETASISRLPTPAPSPTPIAPMIPPDGDRPLAGLDPLERNGYYTAPPPMQIDPGHDYVAILRTEEGDITIDLFEQETPVTANNFVVLALNGFYDGLDFHEVVPGVVAQGGSPDGTPLGTPGYEFEDEIVPELRHDQAGRVSMANRGPDTNCSQFFITFLPAPQIDRRYTIFGQVIEGLDVAQQLKPRKPGEATGPGSKILRVDIETR